jgi:arabinofuranosyltransferase
VLLRTAWYSDDSYITFRAVENFVAGFGPRWNPDERVQAFTHALWFFCVSAVRAVSGEVYYSVYALSVGLTLAAVAVIVQRTAASIWCGVYAAAALLSSRAFIDYSTSGLENPLTNLLLAAFVLVYTAPGLNRAAPRLAGLSGLAALLMANRLDTGLLVLPVVAVEAWHIGWRSFPSLLVGFLPLVAWETFSLIYYGFPVPNTVYAKLPPNLASRDFLPQGVLYFRDSFTNDPVTLSVMAVAIVGPLLAGPRRLWPFSVGLAVSLVWVLRVGGDFMSGRFFASPFFMAVAVSSLMSTPHRRLVPLLSAAAVCVLGFMSPHPPLLASGSFDGRVEPPSGITDERRWYYQNSGLLREKNLDAPLSTRRQEHVKRALARGLKVTTTTSIGYAGYFAGRQFHIVDVVALADPLLSRLPTTVPWRIGHYQRDVPAGYMDTLGTGRNVIADPGVAMFYDQLALVTRGPLWTRARWSAIVRMNLGQLSYLLEGYSRQLPGVRAVDLIGPRPTDPNPAGHADATSFAEGLVLYLDQPRRFRRAEFSLDATQDYRTVYLYKGQERFTELIPARSPDGAGFTQYQQALPESAGEVDQIRIFLRRGRPPGRLAYWRVLE